MQTLKNTLHIPAPLELSIVQQIFFPATGVLPAEIMFGRCLRSLLGLVNPADGISSSCRKTAGSKKRPYRSFQKLQLPAESSLMIRNCTPGGSKWIPFTVIGQTGPLSQVYTAYERCRLLKRCLNQILHRSSSI